MRRRSWRGVVGFVVPAALVIAGCLLVAASAGATGKGKKGGGEAIGEASERNRQVRISTTEEGVEIEVRSTTLFPMRALPPILRIGEREFTLSRNPDDGRLDTLIFMLPAEEFAQLRATDEVTVFHAISVARPSPEGQLTASVPEPGGHVWSFGKLQTDLLDREPDEPQE